MAIRVGLLAVLFLAVCLPWGRGESRSVDDVIRSAGKNAKIQVKGGFIMDSNDLRLTAEQFMRLHMDSHTRDLDYGPTIKTWPGGVVPYTIDYELSSQSHLKSKILAGMRMWEKFTCLTFRPKVATDAHWMRIHDSKDGCWSNLGYETYETPQKLSLEIKGCFYGGTVEHELGHAIGLVHEHQRPESHDYLVRYMENVKPDSTSQLETYKSGSIDKMGLKYDYYSIMHYSQYAFACRNCERTIWAYDWTNQKFLHDVTRDLGQVIGPSFTDALLVNKMYKCQGNPRCSNPPACAGANCFVSSDCTCVCKEEDMPALVCDDNKNTCAREAKPGECYMDMPYYCRKSCKLCPPKGNLPLEKPIIDEEPTGEPTCTDARPADWCQEMKKYGLCSENESYMRRECALTCGLCSDRPAPQVACTDSLDTSVCQTFKDNTYCSIKEDYMKLWCPKTCNMCPGATGPAEVGDCSDVMETSWCKARKEDSNLCQRKPDYMKIWCQSTCNMC